MSMSSVPTTIHDTHEQAHPGAPVYVRVATILTILTAFEVGVLYVEPLRPLFVPVLLCLSIVKFGIVAGYYMHLRFDSRIFTGFFALGIVVAIAIILAFMALMLGHTPEFIVTSAGIQPIPTPAAEGAQH